MPLVHLLYRCPECGHDPMSGEGDTAWCITCGVRFQRGGEGGLLRVRDRHGALSQRPAATLARAVEDGKVVPQEASTDVSEGYGQAGVAGNAGPWRALVRVRIADQEEPIRFRGETLGFFEVLGEETSGVLELTEEALVLRLAGPEGGSVERSEASVVWKCGLLEIGAIQTSSSSVQIAPREGGLVQFKFLEDSPRRWDRLLQDRVRAVYRSNRLGEIAEFQPRIVVKKTSAAGPERPPLELRSEPGGSKAPNERPRGRWGPEAERPEPWLTWYTLVRALVRVLVRLGTRLEVVGLQHVPRSGPFILVANHQSVLDPLLVQTVCPRPLHTFTKSTQFSSRVFRWLLARINCIPTRRYRIDPQVVRVALRRLGEGRGVGIYPEGERSWDGNLQPFRQGTIRLLLRAGVPVVPCGLDGSYDVWPRWSRKIRRRRVRIRFGEPIRWPVLTNRAARDAALSEASETLRQRLIDLGAWSELREGDGEEGSGGAGGE